MYRWEICTERDIDRVVAEVRRGEPVVVHVGGLRLRRRLSAGLALNLLGDRLRVLGAELRLSAPPGRLRRLLRGRLAIAAPPAGGGDPAGVREPRLPPPVDPARSLRWDPATD